jgi:23S rRNA (pseudouridine1915-N3)-methyltransferase
MFKVKVITVGKCKEEWLKTALFEYEKRLKNKMQIDWILVETNQELIERSLKESTFITLDLKGKLLNSREVSQHLFSLFGLKPTFIIGGAEGLDPQIVRRASFSWSLSPLTFTHQMTRLILVEQLYRALAIEEGSAYHK